MKCPFEVTATVCEMKIDYVSQESAAEGEETRQGPATPSAITAREETTSEIQATSEVPATHPTSPPIPENCGNLVSADVSALTAHHSRAEQPTCIRLRAMEDFFQTQAKGNEGSALSSTEQQPTTEIPGEFQESQKIDRKEETEHPAP